MKAVCVTGAGGYIASWVVKLLLSKGYMVHGTVRDPCDEKKNGHLLKLENAKERLKLFKADLLEYDDLCAAFASCIGVLHVASPVPGKYVTNPQVELLDPAIIGTQNVLNACLNAKVEKVVVVSSASAVIANPEWPSDKEMDESCWTDIEHAKSTQQWYAVSKTVAEIEALEYAKRDDDLNVVTVCPSFVIGPMLQPTINTTSLLLLSYMKEEGRTKGDTMENNERPYLDVRDLSEAIILLYENPESNGRYICSTCSLKTKEFVAKMESLFPGYNYPKFFTEKGGFALSSQKLLNLGWSYRPLEDTIIDTVKNYEELGLLAKGKPFPSTITF